MDYKEKYEKALSIAKKNLEAIEEHGEGTSFAYDGVKNTLIHIFPELRESEDEKIRKALIKAFKSYDNPKYEWGGILTNDILAWLERQKPVEEINGDDYGIDGLYATMDILNKTLGQVEGYQSDDGILAHKAAMTAVKKLYKQRPAEWSEEDDIMVENVRNSFGLHCGQMTEALKEQYDKFFNKVKSLRPQLHWKPSEEQMKALNAINCNGAITYAGQGNHLISLYKQLKAL